VAFRRFFDTISIVNNNEKTIQPLLMAAFRVARWAAALA
jgi:hypothetical protein